MTDLATCQWCGAPFEAAKRGGHAKKFCSGKHKVELHDTARRWTLEAIEVGLISPQMLRQWKASCTTDKRPVASDVEVGGA